MGYKAAVAAAGAAATTATGATEGVLMSRALELLSKILPWAGEKGIGAETNDFLPVSVGVACLFAAQLECGKRYVHAGCANYLCTPFSFSVLV